MAAGKREEAAHRIEAQQIGRNFQHRADVAEVCVADVNEAALEDSQGGFMEGVVAVDVFGREAGDLCARVFAVAVVVEPGAVGEINPVKGQNRHDVDVAARRWPATDAAAHAFAVHHMCRKICFAQCRMAALQCKQLFNEMRHSKHCRTHVEGESVRTMYERPPARPSQLFQHRCVESEALQAYSERQSTYT